MTSATPRLRSCVRERNIPPSRAPRPPEGVQMEFPATRMRRLRRTEALRRMVRETRLSPDQLIQPLFVVPGKDVKKAVASMPGVAQLSLEHLVAEAKRAFDA